MLKFYKRLSTTVEKRSGSGIPYQTLRIKEKGREMARDLSKKIWAGIIAFGLVIFVLYHKGKLD